MKLALAGFTPNVLDERTVQYQCDCSAERTKEMLLSLGRAELVRMRDEDPNCEVVCHFCHSKYQYDLNALLAEYDARLHRPLKPNIPYNKKICFSKGGCAVVCSRLFCFCVSEASCFYS